MLALLGNSDTPSVSRYLRSLRGDSQPILAQATDGKTYVIKCPNAAAGQNLLFNEAMGTALYQACGIPVPEWRVVRLTEEFLSCNSSLWSGSSEAAPSPIAGLCFGSQFLGNRIWEILPASRFPMVRNQSQFWLSWLVDFSAAHARNRQALFVEDSDATLAAVFLDHGYMFGGSKGTEQADILASRYLDSRIYTLPSAAELRAMRQSVATLDSDHLWTIAHGLPEEWKTSSALQRFADCLNLLANGNLVLGMLELLIGTVSHRTVATQRKGPVSHPRLNPESIRISAA